MGTGDPLEAFQEADGVGSRVTTRVTAPRAGPDGVRRTADVGPGHFRSGLDLQVPHGVGADSGAEGIGQAIDIAGHLVEGHGPVLRPVRTAQVVSQALREPDVGNPFPAGAALRGTDGDDHHLQVVPGEDPHAGEAPLRLQRHLQELLRQADHRPPSINRTCALRTGASMPLVTGALKPVEQAAQAQPGLGAINENGGVLVGHEQGRYEAISPLPDVPRGGGRQKRLDLLQGYHGQRPVG